MTALHVGIIWVFCTVWLGILVWLLWLAVDLWRDCRRRARRVREARLMLARGMSADGRRGSIMEDDAG